jgi:hypothetical protein
MVKRWALGQYLLRYHTYLLLLSPPERYKNSKKGNAKMWDVGIMECWNFGIMEKPPDHWNDGIPE